MNIYRCVTLFVHYAENDTQKSAKKFGFVKVCSQFRNIAENT